LFLPLLAAMVDNQFFAESREQSQIKARIVAKYFWAWAKVVMPSTKMHDNRIAYIDLFAGPGRYDDGTMSTPLLVLQKAIDDPDMQEMLVTLFNDKNPQNASKLKAAIRALPGIKKLKHKPQVMNEIVGEEIAKRFAEIEFVPTFFFVDPWGYKGLSLGLINSVLRNWGCDCVFFFNYNRVNMGLNNRAVRRHMDVLFGKERAKRLRVNLESLSPDDREQMIVEELSQSLKDMGARYVLPFTFKDEAQRRTKHHLVFATKHFKGYEIMKGIMAKESSEHMQGVPSFEYSPASEKFPTLFEMARPLDDLVDMLLGEFAGESLTMNDIYMRHSVGRPYISSNYKSALMMLEKNHKIKTEPPAEDRRKNTFADHVLVTFPKRKRQ
jgi:three-Cys-motif partner protein